MPIQEEAMVSTYSQLCPVLFGPGAVGQLGDKIKGLGGTKVLCLYDNGVRQSGISDKIVRLITDAGISVVAFGGVLPDAPAEMINEVGLLAQQEKVDIVVGVGGGSTLDTAKAAAVLVQNPLPVSRYYVSRGAQFVSTTPLILIPTTSGTGSECTIMSVVHDKETQMKDSVLRAANLAIVDPELTLTVPKAITAMTGFDALSHAVEALTTNCGNPKSDILALSAITLVAENLEKACRDGSDLEARTNLSLASNLAGIAFNDAFLHFGHAAAHEFGVIFHMPHGVACALTIPEVIRFSSDAAPAKTIKIAKALGLELKNDVTGHEAGELAAQKVRQMMRALEIKSLKAQGISREDAVGCAEGAIRKNPFVSCALKPVTPAVMAELLGLIYDNYM
jgi:alcohol dehydrogenase class IV